MDGYYYLKNGDYLERVTQSSGSLSLLGKAGDFEVMEQVIKEDVEFCVIPGDKEKLVEFFYILKGKVKNNADGTIMGSGDIFYVNQLETAMYFTVVKKAKLLYIINDSLFVMLSDSISKLTKKLAIIEKKDVYTEKHSERVMKYTIALAKKIGLDNVNMMELTYASLFHDLGKIEIPDEILLKPAKLTREEFEYIKKHPALGKVYVDEIKYMKNIGMIIEQHHERIDGSGYPLGLKGDEICQEAKIIAIVDSYDAMTTDRSYRKAMTDEEAIAELLKYKGSYYDAKILQAFIGILRIEKKD